MPAGRPARARTAASHAASTLVRKVRALLAVGDAHACTGPTRTLPSANTAKLVLRVLCGSPRAVNSAACSARAKSAGAAVAASREVPAR